MWFDSPPPVPWLSFFDRCIFRSFHFGYFPFFGAVLLTLRLFWRIFFFLCVFGAIWRCRRSPATSTESGGVSADEGVEERLQSRRLHVREGKEQAFFTCLVFVSAPFFVVSAQFLAVV